jgi:hypothetical protein
MFYYTMFRRTNKDVILCKLIENAPIMVNMEKEVEKKYVEIFNLMQNVGGEFKAVRKEWFTKLLNVCK